MSREDLCTKQTFFLWLSGQEVLHREKALIAIGLKISEFLVLTLQFNTTIVFFECGLDKAQQRDSHRDKQGGRRK